jgi:hypothetical protein
MGRIGIFAWMMAAAIAATAYAAEPTTRPLCYRHELRADPPMQLHILTVDLTDAAFHIKVSHGRSDPKLTPPWGTTLMTVSRNSPRA